MVKKEKSRTRKSSKTKEGLDLLQKKMNRDNKVSPLISRFNFSYTSEVGQGEGGGGVLDRAHHGSHRDTRVNTPAVQRVLALILAGWNRE